MGSKIKSVPVILKENQYNNVDLKNFEKENKILNKIDIYKSQLVELFQIYNPQITDKSKYNSSLDNFLIQNNAYSYLKGNWIYFPWNGHFIHCVDQHKYFQLLTNRNQQIISKKEQSTLENFTVSIAGLSVGSNLAFSLMSNGISKSINISDFDIISTSNLNRIFSGVHEINLQKTDFTARKLFEINPYCNVNSFQKLSTSNLKQFILGSNLIIDEIDDFTIKIELRKYAKQHKIPLLMATSVGDRLIFDIERFDLNPNLPILHGLLTDDDIRIILESDLSNISQINEIVLKFVDKKNISPIVLDSLKAINKTLIGRPQVSSSVSTATSITAFIIREIALHKFTKSGRIVFDLQALLSSL
ncbi:hypothetical protein DID75_00780 [Candidatus Marinamargulisbacteria bacterium SCGC AG-410-N11]|nr:hypothetical protein DID75_00780 [Candidatus Marinamargulisbacteria bacterium SCGC AG-410-N11]